MSYRDIVQCWQKKIVQTLTLFWDLKQYNVLSQGSVGWLSWAGCFSFGVFCSWSQMRAEAAVSWRLDCGWGRAPRWCPHPADPLLVRRWRGGPGFPRMTSCYRYSFLQHGNCVLRGTLLWINFSKSPKINNWFPIFKTELACGWNFNKGKLKKIFKIYLNFTSQDNVLSFSFFLSFRVYYEILVLILTSFPFNRLLPKRVVLG